MLRRLPQIDVYMPNIPTEDLCRGLYLDLETTSPDPFDAKVIQLGTVGFEYNRRTGEIGRLNSFLDLFEDPGVPIPPEITELTGINDAMVVGQKIDPVLLRLVLREVDVVVAHNAEYDRKVAERHWPGLFEQHDWACTQWDVPWRQLGYRSMVLELLLNTVANTFYTAHRALDDCRAGVHLLARGNVGDEASGDVMVMEYLLRKVRQPMFRVWAVDSPFETKNALKRRGYRAYYTPGGKFRCWWKEVPEADLGAEVDWCRKEGYARPVTTVLTAKERYSVRADQMPLEDHAHHGPYG